MTMVNLESFPVRSLVRSAAFVAMVTVAATASAQSPTIRCPSPARYSYGLAYDSLRNVTVLFGGFNGLAVEDETWEWDGREWTRHHPANTPPARANCGMVFDAGRGVTVLFGGGTPGVGLFDDTWEWNGVDWQQVGSGGPRPREGHAMVYDAGRGRTVLFSGQVDVSPHYDSNDTWEWDGTTWTQRFPSTAPPPRNVGRMVYDSQAGVSLLFGGAYVPSLASLDDTWEWDGTDWTERMPAQRPAPRVHHALAFDTLRGIAVLHGGYTYGTSNLFSDTWEWDGMDWTQVASSGPARRFISGVYDDLRARVLFLGGHDGTKTRNGTWEFEAATWTWERIVCNARMR